MYTFAAGVNTSFSSQLNTNFKHGIINGTTSINFTPTSSSAKIIIIAKGWADYGSNTSAWGDTVTLYDSVSGTLDTVTWNVGFNAGGQRYKVPFCLTFIGTLTAASHTLSFSGPSSGSIVDGKIVAMEFLP